MNKVKEKAQIERMIMLGWWAEECLIWTFRLGYVVRYIRLRWENPESESIKDLNILQITQMLSVWQKSISFFDPG